MNRKKTTEELLKQSLGLFNEPSTEQMDSAADRIRVNLRAEAGKPHEEAAIAVESGPINRRRPLLFAAAAAGVVAVVAGTGILLQQGSTPSNSPFVNLKQIENRQVFHANDRNGTTLALPDDSRIEMRDRTELSFERATDGLRILLKEGSILVSAAKQRAGHLYVKTKDVTVSVVGTVFLVKAEQQGSRVAVIEGEVRVQQGATTERLLPGEHVATSSVLAARPMIEEIAWSRHAEEHFAMLQQARIPPVATASEPADRFEVVSIRPSPPPPGGIGSRGGGGGGTLVALPCTTANAFEMAMLFELNPGRLLMRRQTLYSLIAFAYANSCPAPDTMTGGPDWAMSERFDLEATLPAGTPRYTKEQLFSGNAPRLQRMLQNVLADRFKVILKREVKEVPGYNLVVAQDGKLTLSADQTPDQPPARGGVLRRVIGIPSISAPISRLVSMLQRSMDRPIVDKTGLTGLYDVLIEFPEISVPNPPPDGTTVAEMEAQTSQVRSRIQDLLPARLEATTGLKLETAKVPVEVVVIVSAERPSPN